MKRRMLLLLALLLLMSLCACGERLPEAAPAPEATAARPSAEPVRQPSPTAAPTTAPSAAPTPTADLEDRPANRDAAPENVWVEIDYERDGVPFDPSAPARDGHSHVWIVDTVNSYHSTCLERGKFVHVCSVCGRKYLTWEETSGHHYVYETAPQGHRLVCADCGSYYNTPDWTAHQMILGAYGGRTCSVCGWHEPG